MTTFHDFVDHLTALRARQIAVESEISALYRDARRSRVDLKALKEAGKQAYASLKARNDHETTPAKIAVEKTKIEETSPPELVGYDDGFGVLDSADVEIDDLIRK
jgi:hypothetical protein